MAQPASGCGRLLATFRGLLSIFGTMTSPPVGSRSRWLVGRRISTETRARHGWGTAHNGGKTNRKERRYSGQRQLQTVSRPKQISLLTFCLSRLSVFLLTYTAVILQRLPDSNSSFSNKWQVKQIHDPMISPLMKTTACSYFKYLNIWVVYLLWALVIGDHWRIKAADVWELKLNKQKQNLHYWAASRCSLVSGWPPRAGSVPDLDHLLAEISSSGDSGSPPLAANIIDRMITSLENTFLINQYRLAYNNQTDNDDLNSTSLY